MGDWRHRLGTVVRRVGASPLGGLLGGAHTAATVVEVSVARAWASRNRVTPYAGGDVTLAIKTFERPRTLRRMLATVRDVFAGPVLIADDSATPYRSDDPSVRVIELPFDSGVGAGRTRLLDEVETEFVWMCDDDFILLPDFDLDRAVSFLRRHPEVDLYGGSVIKVPQLQSFNYASRTLLVTGVAPKAPIGSLIEGIPVLSKVPNFYLARTEAVRAVGYDPRLKRLDHNDFFSSALGRLVCCYDRRWRCLHSQTLFDRHYQSFRNDIGADQHYLAQKWSAAGQQVSGGVPAEALSRFHLAAIASVAADLGVTAHPAAADTLRSDQPAALIDAMASLGWTVGRGQVRHPLWGSAAVVPGAAPTAASRPDADPPTGPSASVGLTWAARSAQYQRDDSVWVAKLPLGPVIRLDPPASELWRSLEAGPVTADEAVDRVLAAHPDAPADADRQLHGLLADLVSQGFVE